MELTNNSALIRKSKCLRGVILRQLSDNKVKRVKLAIGLAMVIAVFWPDLNYAAVADVKCNVANAPAIVGAYAALAHAPVPAIRNTPIAELSSQFQLQKIMPYKLGLSISRESALLRTQLPSKQVDDILAANQANQILVKPIKVSTDELSRAKKSQECRTALSNLNKSFERNRVDMGFDPDSAFGLNDFSTWYFTTTRSPQQQAAAALVVKAQQAYDQACLSNAVPVDVGPDLIRRAVGMFSFNEIPFCTGLRTKLTTFTPGAALLTAPVEQPELFPSAFLKPCICNWLTTST